MMSDKFLICRACCAILLLGGGLVSAIGCNSTNANGESSELAKDEVADNGATKGESTADTTSSQDATPDSSEPDPSVAARPTLDITFDDLKFPHKVDQPYDSALLTKKVLSYVGHNIRVRGWILPTFQENGIKSFVLVRDNQECCFGPGAALFDCVRVQMDDDNLVKFTSQPISVEGRFSIEEARDYKDVTRAVFFMHGKVVK